MKVSSSRNVWLFFAAVYAASAVLFLPVLLSGRGMAVPANSVLVALVTFVPSVMGVVFTYRTKGPHERPDFWRRTLRWPRGRTKAALAGLVLLPSMVVTSFAVVALISGAPTSLAYAAELLTDGKTLLVFLFVEFTFGALSEELGWRGYALDELQARWGPLAASLVLGLIWAVWHTPCYLIPGLAQYENGGLFSWTYAGFLIAVPVGSVLHTWVYNRTGRSILVAGILMHGAQNATLVVLGGIFDRFRLPPAFWPVFAVVAGVIAFLLVRTQALAAVTGEPGEGRGPQLATRIV